MNARSTLRFPLSFALVVALVVAFSQVGLAAPPAAPAQQPAPAATPSTPAPQKDAKPVQDAPAGTSPSAPSDAKPGPANPSQSKPEQSKPEAAADAKIFARFESSSGNFRVELATRAAPRLCANFINLVNRGYYDGKPWSDFSPVVRQTGNNPNGDPEYTLPREFSKDLLFDKPGRLCYGNNADDATTARARPTRIFVTVKPQDRWNLQYAVFGVVVSGLDVATRLNDGEKITRVVIEGDFKAHQERYAKLIAQWNAALDRAGLPATR